VEKTKTALENMNNNEGHNDIALQCDISTDHEDATLLLRQTLPPFYGPELPHPSEHLLLDENSDNIQMDELLDRHICRLFRSYSVDINNGFLPHIDPLHQLPLSSKFACWELIMKDLSQYLHAKNIRSVILSRLDILHVEENDLLDEREFERALLVLSMLSHAFVWGEKPISTYIPSCLSIPWVEITKRACRPPVLTHSLIALTNWKRFNIEKAIELGNIAMLNCFMSGTDEANFYLVIIELECRGAKALKHMLRAQYFSSKGNIKELINELKAIQNIQKTMFTTLLKTYEEVDPYIFYNRVRHFLAGWKGNPLLPDGILYEGVTETRQVLHGASAAQSSLIATFDVFFDVKHDSEHTRQFINEMRFYMPPEHRQFLEMLSLHKYNINDFVKNLTSFQEKQQEKELIDAYNHCIDQLIAFRNKHIQIVALYILAQIPKNDFNVQLESKKENDHTVNNNEIEKKDETASSARGTGGTILMPFLKTCRDETKVQRLN
jgi:indoleamine 2,3-dioxygenase